MRGGVRAPGDFWGFCLVAEGAADVMLEGVDLAPWDIAALIPIVEEAGRTPSPTARADRHRARGRASRRTGGCTTR